MQREGFNLFPEGEVHISFPSTTRWSQKRDERQGYSRDSNALFILIYHCKHCDLPSTVNFEQDLITDSLTLHNQVPRKIGREGYYRLRLSYIDEFYHTSTSSSSSMQHSQNSISACIQRLCRRDNKDLFTLLGISEPANHLWSSTQNLWELHNLFYKILPPLLRWMSLFSLSLSSSLSSSCDTHTDTTPWKEMLSEFNAFVPLLLLPALPAISHGFQSVRRIFFSVNMFSSPASLLPQPILSAFESQVRPPWPS